MVHVGPSSSVIWCSWYWISAALATAAITLGVKPG
jgi:hypothetical protein